MASPVHSKTLYNITYKTPGGNEKWLFWRGKDAGNACRSWLQIMPGATIISVKPYVMKWTY